MTEQGVVPYKPAKGLVSKPGLSVVVLQDVLSELGLGGPRKTAEELIGQTFIIRSAKPFASSFQEGAHAYFCVCAFPDTGESFTAVLGGQAVVDLLDAYIDTGQGNPIQVTLQFQEGGKFAGYYTLG